MNCTIGKFYLNTCFSKEPPKYILNKWYYCDSSSGKAQKFWWWSRSIRAFHKLPTWLYSAAIAEKQFTKWVNNCILCKNSLNELVKQWVMRVSLATTAKLGRTGNHSVWHRAGDINSIWRSDCFSASKRMCGVWPYQPFHVMCVYKHRLVSNSEGKLYWRDRACIWGLVSLSRNVLCQHKAQYYCISLKLYEFPPTICLLFLQASA